MTTRVLVMTAIHAGLTFPCTLKFDSNYAVYETPGEKLDTFRKSLNKRARDQDLPDVVVAHDVPDLDVRTVRMHVRYGYRPVLLVHASHTPEEAALLARGMGKQPPSQQEWTTRMMRVQNIASEFGRVDVSGEYLLYVYADDGVAGASEAVGSLIDRAMSRPPPDPSVRLLPA